MQRESWMHHQKKKKDLLLNVRERHEGDTYRVAGCNAELISKKQERENEWEKNELHHAMLCHFSTQKYFPIESLISPSLSLLSLLLT